MISNEVMAKLIAAREKRDTFMKNLAQYKRVGYVDVGFIFGIFRDEHHSSIFCSNSRFPLSVEVKEEIEAFVLERIIKESDRLIATAEENFRKEISENIEL